MTSRFVLVTLVVLVCPAIAQESVPLTRTNRSLLQARDEAALQASKFKKGDYMFSDWGGLRGLMFDSGVEVFGFYNSIFNGNVSGGTRPGHATYVDDLWLGVKFDLEKLVGWRGGLLAVSGINRQGDDLTSRYIGSIYSTQQSVGGQRPFLYQAYLQQKLFDNRLTLKAGRFGASDDFNTSPFYGYSLNNGINGNIRNVLFDTRFSAYPFAVWAAALLYDPTPAFQFKFGFFQTSDDMFENDDNGMNWGIEGSDGYTAIAQFGWSPQFGQRPVSVGSPGEGKATTDGKTTTAPALKGLPGHYWVGFTYSDWDFYPRFDGGFRDRSYGFYANADQMVYQEAPGSEEGLYVFLASGYYPQTEISIVPFQVNAGLNYKGLFPHRPDDRTMLHFIYGELSNEYSRSVRVLGGSSAESEKVVEIAHRFQITKWSYFQPDLQYVAHPGGTGDIEDAVVIGAQMGVTF